LIARNGCSTLARTLALSSASLSVTQYRALLGSSALLLAVKQVIGDHHVVDAAARATYGVRLKTEHTARKVYRSREQDRSDVFTISSGSTTPRAGTRRSGTSAW
jgi:hypothetical protein